MIAETNANCKVLKTEIQDSTAIITLLLFSNKTTYPSKAFRIYLQDKGKAIDEAELLSNSLYWIDYNTSFDNSLNNVNINKYKEIKLNIDITNNNSSKNIDNRWVRECYIHLFDESKPIVVPAWSSDLLTLISKKYELPILKSFTHYSELAGSSQNEDYYKLHFDIKIDYESDTDYNYNNKNFYYILEIKSTTTNKIIETIKSTDNILLKQLHLESSEFYLFNRAVTIEFKIKDNSDRTILTHSKTFIPEKKLSNTYIKTKDGIKNVKAFYIKREITESDVKSEWLEGDIDE